MPLVVRILVVVSPEVFAVVDQQAACIATSIRGERDLITSSHIE